MWLYLLEANIWNIDVCIWKFSPIHKIWPNFERFMVELIINPKSCAFFLLVQWCKQFDCNVWQMSSLCHHDGWHHWNCCELHNRSGQCCRPARRNSTKTTYWEKMQRHNALTSSLRLRSCSSLDLRIRFSSICRSIFSSRTFILQIETMNHLKSLLH